MSRILLQLLLGASAALGATSGWHFVQNGTSGVLALEAMVVSPTLAVFFDRATNDPLQINGHTAWGALWSFETNTAIPLDMVSDTFCASGGFLSNGTMLNVGGHIPVISQAVDGRMAVRMLEPCADPTGASCHIIDNPATLHLAETRWYPSSLRIFDGSLMIVGGIHERTEFFNTDPVNSFEFFPSKDGGIPRNSSFLARTVPANLFPRVFALPDGKVFMVANNQSIIYDIEAKTETPLPDIPNGVRVTNPFDGTATLLPLSPPDYIPEVLVCGGTNSSDAADAKLSSQDPASDQCSRITLTPQGIKKGWVIERMLERRMMPEMILLPNGQVLIVNGAGTGYAALAGDVVADPIGGGNADHPVFTPSLYTPDAPIGQRFSNKGLPTTDIARLYHSTATLTPMGNIMLAGSNPNNMVVNDTVFATEFRVEYLNPPFMSVARPKLLNVPKKVAFNKPFVVNVTIPSNLPAKSVKVGLMDLGFSSHAFHSSSRLVFLNAVVAPNRKSIIVESPPNNRIYPPGPGFLFLTVDDVTSTGEMLIIGTGAPPPVPEQGLRL